jgi:hypothetical protein
MTYNEIELEKLNYIHSLKNPSFYEHLKPDFFDNNIIKTLYQISKSFYMKYKTSPSSEQIWQIIKQSKFKDSINRESINQVFSFCSEYDSCDPVWVKETVECWIQYKNIFYGILKSSELLKITQISPQNINFLRDKIKSIVSDHLTINFENSLGIDFFNAESHYQAPQNFIPSGRRFFDLHSGGYETGTLVAYAGMPNVGKSHFLGNDAAHFVRIGENVVIISAEMKESKFVRRIGSNILNIPINQYNDFAKDPVKVKERLEELSTYNTPGKFYIKQMVDPNVNQISAYVKKIEDVIGEKVRIVIIDYLNIMSDLRNPNTENIPLKIKNITKDLRDDAVLNQYVAITASQLNREGYDNSELTLKSIAESSGLSFNADVIYGIIQDPTMLANDFYYLKLLKTRDSGGKAIKCRYDMDWNYLRLKETNEIIETLL